MVFAILGNESRDGAAGKLLDDAAVDNTRRFRRAADQHHRGPARFHSKAGGTGFPSAHPQSLESGATRRMAFKKDIADFGFGIADSTPDSSNPQSAIRNPSFNPSTFSANT